MAFRKRNVVLGQNGSSPDGSKPILVQNASGVKPSPLTSHMTTSTGAQSFDALLGGHGGLLLGCSLLVQESGTTDFAGALLKYFAAEGICHGHTLHIVGLGSRWVRELPGIATNEKRERKTGSEVQTERMKIAWRYETSSVSEKKASVDRSSPVPASSGGTAAQFCQPFDLAKRLDIPNDANISYHDISSTDDPFRPILESLSRHMAESAPGAVHRLIIPTILSPALYPPQASRPENSLRFLQSLRNLLRKYPYALTVMMTLPLELHPRVSGLVRWAEVFSDGVFELVPFPYHTDLYKSTNASEGGRTDEEQPQGMFRVHKLPVNTERGEGGAGVGNSIGDDLAFTVSRRRFDIRPFSLPPLEGDQDAQKESGKVSSKDLEF